MVYTHIFKNQRKEALGSIPAAKGILQKKFNEVFLCMPKNRLKKNERTKTMMKNDL